MNFKKIIRFFDSSAFRSEDLVPQRYLVPPLTTGMPRHAPIVAGFLLKGTHAKREEEGPFCQTRNAYSWKLLWLWKW